MEKNKTGPVYVSEFALSWLLHLFKKLTLLQIAKTHSQYSKLPSSQLSKTWLSISPEWNSSVSDKFLPLNSTQLSSPEYQSPLWCLLDHCQSSSVRQDPSVAFLIKSITPAHHWKPVTQVEAQAQVRRTAPCQSTPSPPPSPPPRPQPRPFQHSSQLLHWYK